MRTIAALACIAGLALQAPSVAQSPPGTREARLETAERARAAGDYAQARDTLESLLAENPDDPDLLRRLAAVSAAQGDLERAQEQIDRAQALAPEDLDIQLARGNILFWRGEREAAQRQADAIAAVAPDYPELGALRTKLVVAEQAGGFRITALAVGGGVSDIAFDNRDGETWSSQNASIGLALSRDIGASLAVEREERAATGIRLAARLDRRFGQNSAYIAGSVVPDADFRESWSIGTGGEIALGERTSALVDIRYADYRDRNVFAVQPALRYAFNDAASVTLQAINLFGGGEEFRLGGSFRADYRPQGRAGGFVVLASYPDVEADGVRQLRSVATGLIVPLGDRFTLTTVGAYEDRKDSYRRLSGTLVLGFRFGA